MNHVSSKIEKFVIKTDQNLIIEKQDLHLQELAELKIKTNTSKNSSITLLKAEQQQRRKYTKL
jgi:hypothetical protein